MAQLNFDARQVDPQQSFEPIPAGWYNMMIVESEMKPTSNGQGAYLQLSLKVVDGQYAGRQVFDRLNLQNQNPVAAEIAYKRLSAYCHATGVIQVQDSQQLHGIPLKARVSVRTDSTGQYDPSNEIKAVKHINEETGTTAAPAQQGFQAPAQQAPQQGFQQPQQAPQQQWQQPPAQQAPAPQQFQQPAQQPQFQQPAPQQAPAQGGAQTPPWMQGQQAPAEAAQPTPQQAPQQAPAAGQTPPWAQPRQ
ncbi:hypothetical protein ply2008005c_04 [Stenotrophomonas phage vB_SM_ytsc_ply2008005c]|uniref:hypothetical protein n=1 Tax=Stenotrophomonas phage vB_SM_ytsc_ply2008005c TaxID=2894587 RepID=UPI0023EEB2D2|nr:hypothetical protein P6F36_gp04 [Stenotrophomonas phage vB_SM_ytsc_ply2008005c]UFJ83595.1 hypothetical protein ply2008005c_04 [Stenotrophomonas phage vB_SM_ytsc_ply2008005c]